MRIESMYSLSEYVCVCLFLSWMNVFLILLFLLLAISQTCSLPAEYEM